jgi:hypothetical protein
MKLKIFTLVIVQIVIFLGHDTVYSYSFVTTLRMNVLLRNVGIRPQDHTVLEARNPQSEGNVIVLRSLIRRCLDWSRKDKIL